MIDSSPVKAVNKKLAIFVLMLLISFFVSQIYFTASIGTQSGTIEQIRQEKESLRLENEILSASIDEKRTVASILEKAEALELVPKGIIELDTYNAGNIAQSY